MSDHAPRTAVAADLDAIAEIGRRPFAAGWSRAAYAAELGRPDGIFLVVPGSEAAGIEGGAQLRGYAVARVVDEEVRLVDLAAAEDGTGAGRALWSAVAAAGKARGARVLTFEASAANARALAFYEKAGARVVGRRPKFYTDGSDAVLMDFTIP